MTSVVNGLARLSRDQLEELRIDLSAESREKLSRRDIETAVRSLSACLAGASQLRVLSVKLAAYDISMDRLRLSRDAWEDLIRGLSAVSRFQCLRTLELSSMAIKTSQALQAVKPYEEEPCRQLRRAQSAPETSKTGSSSAPGSSALTFLDVLARMSALEELTLTYDEMYGCTAQLLPAVFASMTKLRKVDLTRNHISQQVMKEIRQTLPQELQIQGDGQQSWFFY